jgi:hypothetical protein
MGKSYDDNVTTGSTAILRKTHFPVIDPPGGESLQSHLRSVVESGLERSETMPDEAIRRNQYDELLDAELDAIYHTGFCSYFLLAGDVVAAVPEDAVARGRPLPAGRTLCAYGVGLGTLPPEVTRAKESALIKQLMAGQVPPLLCLGYTYGSFGRLLQYLSGRFEPDCVAVFGEGVKDSSVAHTAQQIKGFFVSDVPVAELVEVPGRFQGVPLVESNEAALVDRGFYPYQLGLSGESSVA